MTINQRRRGWLDQQVHAGVREALLHTCARYSLLCPAYTVMPDHFHFLWTGCSEDSHQLRAASFFRRQLNDILACHAAELQKQGYDHVLQEHEHGPEALPATIQYILQNPVHDGLCERWMDWPFCGAIAVGYPRFSPKDQDFWQRLDSVLRASRQPNSSPCRGPAPDDPPSLAAWHGDPRADCRNAQAFRYDTDASP